jgi:hypothetical protein
MAQISKNDQMVEVRPVFSKQGRDNGADQTCGQPKQQREKRCPPPEVL